jgi:predicted RNA binding protein YcfA (HicA-like mRNA interferase family)
MPRLFSSEHIIRILEKRDFFFVSQKGSHAKYIKKIKGITIVVIVPANRKEIPLGTFHSIMRQARLEKKDFE